MIRFDAIVIWVSAAELGFSEGLPSRRDLLLALQKWEAADSTRQHCLGAAAVVLVDHWVFKNRYGPISPEFLTQE